MQGVQQQQQLPTELLVQPPQPLPLAQWQADRICSAAAAGSPSALAAALTAVGCTVDSTTTVTTPDAVAIAVVNCRDSIRCLTPLHCAAAAAATNEAEVEAGAGECAAILLLLGANPNARDGHGCTPLHYAARYASPAVCQRLLAIRASRLDLRNSWGRTALMFTAWGGDEVSGRTASGNELRRLEIARALISSGANVDIRDSRGRTAAMWAALTGKVALLRLLLSSGADWRRRNFDGLTAAQLAQREGHTEVARLLNLVADEALKSPPPAANTAEGSADGVNQKDGGAAAGTEATNAATGTA